MATPLASVVASLALVRTWSEPQPQENDRSQHFEWFGQGEGGARISGSGRLSVDDARPVQRTTERVNARLLDIYREMAPVLARMRPHEQALEQIDAEMAPLHEQVEAIHREMEPIHQEMERIHERMRPVHDRMEAIHREIRPFEREAERFERELRPYNRRIEKIEHSIGEIDRSLLEPDVYMDGARCRDLQARRTELRDELAPLETEWSQRAEEK